MILAHKGKDTQISPNALENGLGELQTICQSMGLYEALSGKLAVGPSPWQAQCVVYI